jgi:hypothetical protein
LRDHVKTVLNTIEILQHMIDLEGVDLTPGLENIIKKHTGEDDVEENVKERIKLARQQRA